MSAATLTPENDPAAIAEALRRLSELAVREDCDLINSLGSLPDDVKNQTLSGAITHPIWYAARYAINVLVAHLGSLIGAEAAHAPGSKSGLISRGYPVSIIVNERVWMKSAAVSYNTYVCINHNSEGSRGSDGFYLMRLI